MIRKQRWNHSADGTTGASPLGANHIPLVRGRLPRRRRWRGKTHLVLAFASVGLAVALSACSQSPQLPAKSTSQTSKGVTTSSSTSPGAPSTTAVPPTTTTQPAPSSWVSSGGGLEPVLAPRAVPDEPLNAAFSSQLGPGWVGGDSTYSTKLADGRIAFVFSDTLIGTAQPDGAASFTGMVHSSELVGVPPSLAFDVGGDDSSPQALIPDTYDTEGIWETAATYTQGQNQMIFVNEFSGPGGILTLRYSGQSGIAVMSVVGNGLPTLSSVTLLPEDKQTTWGSAEVSSGGYMYIYGANPDPTKDFAISSMKVARVPLGHTTDVAMWTYWNGSQWVAGESNAIAVQTVNNLSGVEADPDGVGFIGVSVPSGLYHDTTVNLSYASSPQGPWSAPQPVYVIPEIKEYAGEMAYFPTFHPELASKDQLVVSYNLNTVRGYSVLLQDIHSYQPVFITISG